MSVAERREAVRALVTHGLSVQRACVLVQRERASFQYQPRSTADDRVVTEIAALAQAHPRYGYRRVWALLRRKRSINRKRVHRLWKRARLQVQRPKRRRQRRERSLPLAAAYPNHIWAYDFVEDQDVHGHILRMLTGMDEFTREGLAIDVESSTSGERVIGVLVQLVAAHGVPAYLRSDNGSEFVAMVVQAWREQRQIQTLYIDPGCPWQNGTDERCNGTVRDECLKMQLFASVAEARIRLELFRRHYNDDRPHSRLGYQTPSEFTRAWLEGQANQQDSHIST
jgi:putative transposase